MITSSEFVQAALIIVIGAVSAFMYGRKRQWAEVALVLIAAAALALLAGRVSLLPDECADLVIVTDAPTSASASTNGAKPGRLIDAREPGALTGLHAAVEQATTLTVIGHGLHSAQWQDLPQRPLQWQAPANDLLWLDFPREQALGRPFKFSVRRGMAEAGWRLQLLAENAQLLAEARADGASAQLSVEWLPPLAGRMLLQAQVLDGAGNTIAKGPVPLYVQAPQPLQVIGRFGAPSFDMQAINQLLVNSGARLDWQVTLGLSLMREETARETLSAPNLLLIDAAYFEKMTAPVRTALLAQVAAGLPLVIAAGNANDRALWQRELALDLQAGPDQDEKALTRQFNFSATPLAMARAALVPSQNLREPWRLLASDDQQQPWLWQRDWKKGQIIWLGAAEWHRHAIRSPAALGQWWQGLLDHAGVRSVQAVQWQFSDPLPLPALRNTLCAQGVTAGSIVQVQDQALRWQKQSGQADALCVAFWPQKAGWLTPQSDGAPAVDAYVFNEHDWPAWQKALRHDATAQYAARRVAASAAAPALPATGKILPDWIYGCLFAAAMLGLWWRERGRASRGDN